MTALRASGAHDVLDSNRREWVTFSANDVMTILYWSQRDGSYYVLREPAVSGPPRRAFFTTWPRRSPWPLHRPTSNELTRPREAVGRWSQDTFSTSAERSRSRLAFTLSRC